MPVYLEAPNMSSDELERAWLDMELLRQKALIFINEQQRLGEVLTDPDSKADFAKRMDVLSQDYRVLDAWAAVLHSAWVFSTQGAESLFFEGTDMRGCCQQSPPRGDH